MTDKTPRIALVTGGNRGIGFEVCRQLAERGFIVLLTAREAAKATAAANKLETSQHCNHRFIVLSFALLSNSKVPGLDLRY